MKTKGRRKTGSKGNGPGCRESGAGDGGFKIQDSRCRAKTPYDGISPEVLENNDARNPEQHVRAAKSRRGVRAGRKL